MPLKISAFPKCYLEEIAGRRSMSVFDWVEMARSLDADGLEMYEGFFTSLEPGYLDSVGEAIASAGFAMPMLCCSPDFTSPDADARRRAADHEAEMIRVTRRLGGPRAVCRVLSGQRYPEVSREQGLEWVVEGIETVLPVAREHDIILGPRKPLQGWLLEVSGVRPEAGGFPDLAGGDSGPGALRSAV